MSPSVKNNTEIKPNMNSNNTKRSETYNMTNNKIDMMVVLRNQLKVKL